MTKLYRLLARAQLDGEVREPGYVFTLKAGERGPHRAMVGSNVGGMAWCHARELTPADAEWPAGWIMPEEPTMRDESLFEAIEN